MSADKSSISNAGSYAEMGEFWDNHSLAEVWEQTEPVPFVISDTSRFIYFPLGVDVSARIRSIAQKRGTSAESLLEEWVQEKMAETEMVSAVK